MELADLFALTQKLVRLLWESNMEITQIKKVGKGERYSIFIDGVFNGTLEDEILVKTKLKVGDQIDEERLKEIKLENGKLAAFSRAVSYIEKGVRTKKQVKTYLKEKGFLLQSIDEALEKLEEYGLVDDSLFAESYIRTYKNKKGGKKLKFELMQKGVSGEIAEEKINELCDEESSFETCLTLAKKYMKNKEHDAKTRQKAYAHLAGKGFSGDIIIKAINKEWKDENWN